jgi:hypothetical protein
MLHAEGEGEGEGGPVVLLSLMIAVIVPLLEQLCGDVDWCFTSSSQQNRLLQHMAH